MVRLCQSALVLAESLCSPHFSFQSFSLPLLLHARFALCSANSLVASPCLEILVEGDLAQLVAGLQKILSGRMLMEMKNVATEA
ncbi:hypothetical protein D9M71_760180 [compost metagenome]